MTSPIVRILVVDDAVAWRGFIGSTLSQWSHARIVAEASDGLEAVRLAQTLTPDLVLLDIGLPFLSGVEVARQIQKVSPHSKILFISEYRSHDIISEAMSSGGSGYLIKSHAGRDLLRAVAEVLEGRRFVSVGDDRSKHESQRQVNL